MFIRFEDITFVITDDIILFSFHFLKSVVYTILNTTYDRIFLASSMNYFFGYKDCVLLMKIRDFS